MKVAGGFLKIVTTACLGWMGIIGVVEGARSAEKVSIVASILPLGSFCERIGGESVDVQVIIPPGASPHVFEPPPSVVAKSMAARVFVFVGSGLEPWAERLLRSELREDLVVVEATRGISLLRSQGRPENHAAQGGNPHVWLDPVLAEEICRRIAWALMVVDPDHRKLYADHLQKYLEELEALHREIESRVAKFRIREFVAFHPSFAYFARRYGLREVGVIEASPGREPSPRHLARIVTAIRRYGVRVVFAEPQLSPRAAAVIAREAAVQVLTLDPMGGRPPYGSDYIEMMRHNLGMLAEAMR